MNSNKCISILGCGWLGLELAKFLISQGYTVKGSTTSKEKLSMLRSSGVIPFKIDLSDPKEKLNKEFFISEILILNIPPGRRKPEMLEAYPTRIQKALNMAKENGIGHCLLISSTGVFSSKTISTKNLDFPRYDQTIPNGKSDTAKVLIRGEELLFTIYESNGTVLRFGGLVGGDRKAGKFLSGKKDLKNGLAPVNMIHRDDCVQIIYEIIEQKRWGYSFNAVADEHPIRQEFYVDQALKNRLSPPGFIETAFADGKIIENAHLKSVLNYQFIHPDPMLF